MVYYEDTIHILKIVYTDLCIKKTTTIMKII
ncbi:hypothetical protein MCETHM1_01540 [Flavobacteriaceae bacterium]